METLLNFWGELPDWVNAITGLVVAATAITALTPSKVDDKWLQKILDTLNFISGNFLKNRNADRD